MIWKKPDIPNDFDWTLLAATGFITFVWGAFAGFNLPTAALWMIFNAATLYFCAGFLKARDTLPSVSALCGAFAWVVATTTIMSHASYVWATANFPFIDETLSAFDRLIGIDKRHILETTGSSWWLSQASLVAYHKTAYEMFLGFGILMLVGNYKRIANTFSILMICIAATLSLSTVAPAAGAFVELKPTAQLMGFLNDPIIGVWHLDELFQLRDGTLRTFPTVHWEGIVTFPSFHTLYALVAGYSLASTRWLALPAALFSGFVIFTTMPVGGHYFLDIIASLGIFTMAVVAVDAEVRQRLQRLVAALRQRRLEPGMA